MVHLYPSVVPGVDLPPASWRGPWMHHLHPDVDLLMRHLHPRMVPGLT